MSRITLVPHFRRSTEWLGILLLIALALALDSEVATTVFAHGQWCANVLVIAMFVAVVRNAPPRLRGVMWWGLAIGTGGEIVFSRFVGMYEYRLANIPIYVPPGHSLLYAAVYYFVREPIVRRHHELVGKLMLGLATSYALYWLATHRDWYGMACTVVFYYFLWRHKSSRMFFLTMYLVVAYLEQVGTRFACWYWHPTLLDKLDWLPSGNPPSGISVFYFGFDAACLEYYARTIGAAPRFYRLRERAEQRQLAGDVGAEPAGA
jgi:hypothetical protein